MFVRRGRETCTGEQGMWSGGRTVCAAYRGRAAVCPSHQAPEASSAPLPAPCKQTLWNSFLGALLPAGVYLPVQGGWLAGVCLPARGVERAGRCLIGLVSGARGSNAVCPGVWWLLCVIACLSARAEFVLDSVRPPVASSPRGCAAREAADSGTLASAGLASLIPRPFHPPLLRQAWRQPL